MRSVSRLDDESARTDHWVTHAVTCDEFGRRLGNLVEWLSDCVHAFSW